MLRPIIASVFLAAVASGCGKTDSPPTPITSESPTATSPTSGGSVAAPEQNLPAPDATLPASGTSGTTNQGNEPSQASPVELGKQQESNQMPLPGQVNNHSTPQPMDPKQ